MSGGEIGPSSDYDFAILFDPSADILVEVAQITHKFAVALETDRIDVIPLNQAGIELAYAVIAQGEILYQQDNVTRVEYEAQIMGLYGDYLSILRKQRAELLQETDHAPRVQRYREALRRTEQTLGEIRGTER